MPTHCRAYVVLLTPPEWGEPCVARACLPYMTPQELAEKLARVLNVPGSLPIVSAGDPVLREKTVPFEGQFPEARLHRLTDRMRETIREIDSAVGSLTPDPEHGSCGFGQRG